MTTLILTILLIITTVVILSKYFGNHLHLYNKDYDKLLNQLMDNKVKVTVQTHTCQFEGTSFYIWIANFPYNYGTTYPQESNYPSMKTRRRLANYIITHRKD